ncbi:class I adenylate-forming enzyme family protein [Pseudosulfitobacter pseudonitzschiae]|nr:class I adenylate-forming enzyme family protein [Pseudosulfitobacter pseudonitzschiae]MCD2313252.1 acyl--CoA ligase [Pseudosulfitobacter pseudonitzschiae]
MDNLSEITDFPQKDHPVMPTPVPLTLPSQTPEERRHTIETAAMPASIGDLLDQAAADSADQVLWTFFDEGSSLTYAQVRSQSLQVGAALGRWGVGQGDRVAVMLPNVPQMPLAWLGLARIGAVMVPVNTRYSPRELRYAIENSGATRLIIHSSFADVLRGEMAGVLTPDAIAIAGADGPESWDAKVAAADAATCPRPDIDRDDLMNIQYTSGTTGLPKGCMLSHRYWLTSGMSNAWRDGQRFGRLLAVTPFSYMDPQWLLLMTMYQRGTLMVGARQSASRFSGWLSQHRIHFCLFPEAATKQPPAAHDADNPVVRANIYGVRASAHAALEARYGLVAREAFGMTEIGSGMYMPMEAMDMVGSGSCGIAAPFRTTRIVDDQGQAVATGEVGELLVKGPGMFQGYIGRPDATAEAFRDGWFRTGDLFRKDAQGYHYIVGRKKDMIRRSGENIACREVEGVLRDMEEIEEVALIPVPDDLRGEEVKAYVQLQDGFQPDAQTVARITAYGSQRLASFKLPRYFEFITDMPRTASFKVAKNELQKARADHRVGSFDRVDQIWR